MSLIEIGLICINHKIALLANMERVIFYMNNPTGCHDAVTTIVYGSVHDLSSLREKGGKGSLYSYFCIKMVRKNTDLFGYRS
jgi:hypothetical protein